ncbi:MAG: ABC transporter ATP-binding protein [Clostridia bacterium]|nr:ABC transporter ATP-binding protein [Clostridia bacterium]
MIEISNLTKKYNTGIAVDDISFSVDKGEIVGLLGPNGAGKSTTMNILTGYLSYTEGSVKIDGLEVVEHPKAVKQKIGYLPEQPPLYPNMSVYDYLKFVYELKKAKGNKKEELEALMEKVNISDMKGRLIKNLSKGYKQRVGLAAAMIGDPEILILDEPTVGLDPVQIIEIRNLIKELGQDKTVILNSHILPEVSAICDRIIIINKGKIIASDTPQNLTKMAGSDQRIHIVVNGNLDDVKDLLNHMDEVVNFEVLTTDDEELLHEILVTVSGEEVSAVMFQKFGEKGLVIRSLAPHEVSLEEVFVKLVSEEEQPVEEEIQPEEEIFTAVPEEEIPFTAEEIAEEATETEAEVLTDEALEEMASGEENGEV